ncbi:MAG: lysozyme [Alphaproteobacteria bacterium]|nr:lysozyme [Alphaproteobacteria bacterium]
MPKYITQAIELIKKFEGLSLNVYLDVGGLPTIGYGHLIKSHEFFPCAITQEQAESLLMADLEPFNRALDCIKAKIGDNQKAAILCLMYNIGVNAFKNSTLLKKINANAELAEIEAQFMAWVYVNKKSVAGLINRRKKEFELFSLKYGEIND